jgi:2-oxoglutarate ferredoxin oxidoreductase subunit alpha
MVVAYGSPSRVVKSAIEIARQQGLRVGLFRPITLYPFPYARLRQLADRVARVLVVELSAGQLAEDVRLAIPDIRPMQVYSRFGGMIPSPEEIAAVLGGQPNNGNG